MLAQIADFPDICSIIYSERKSLNGIRSRYIEELRKTNNLFNSMYANKLEEGAEMLRPAKLKELEREFSAFRDHMRKWTSTNVPITIKYRQKDFIRYNDKIRLCLTQKGKDLKDLDKISDLLGFRIILSTPAIDSIETVNLTYQVLKEVISFFVLEKHALPIETTLPTDTNFDKNSHPEIVLPKKQNIPESFEGVVKDYVMFPKEKGYQSLHIVLRKPNGLTFEVQIRTFAMDFHAELGKASHTLYNKERKAPSDIQLDYSKIDIPGFIYHPNGILDQIGLVHAIDPFNNL